MEKRGQISLEYLMVVGFVVFVVILLLGLAIFYTATAQDSIALNQLTNFANKILNSAETVYFAGEPSRLTITTYLPEGVNEFSIQENSLVFNISTSSGITLTVFPSSVPLDTSSTFNLVEGVKRLQIVATSSNVLVTQV